MQNATAVEGLFSHVSREPTSRLTIIIDSLVVGGVFVFSCGDERQCRAIVAAKFVAAMLAERTAADRPPASSARKVAHASAEFTRQLSPIVLHRRQLASGGRLISGRCQVSPAGRPSGQPATERRERITLGAFVSRDPQER